MALAGIVFVLRTGITWNQLPASVVGCSGVTCWRRMRDWTEAGVWPTLHELLLAELRDRSARPGSLRRGCLARARTESPFQFSRSAGLPCICAARGAQRSLGAEGQILVSGLARAP